MAYGTVLAIQTDMRTTLKTACLAVAAVWRTLFGRRACEQSPGTGGAIG